jgi:ATP-dependent Clp protease ATP-binding subunit ClpX
VPTTVALEGLDKEALVRILKEPRNALVKQYQKLFDMDGVKLTIDDEAVDSIAQQAYEHKTGARGLRTIMEKAMMDVMYEIPSDPDITACRVTKDSVEGKAEPEVVRKQGA